MDRSRKVISENSQRLLDGETETGRAEKLLQCARQGAQKAGVRGDQLPI